MSPPMPPDVPMGVASRSLSILAQLCLLRDGLSVCSRDGGRRLWHGAARVAAGEQLVALLMAERGGRPAHASMCMPVRYVTEV
jgi:hypothetical protein